MMEVSREKNELLQRGHAELDSQHTLLKSDHAALQAAAAIRDHDAVRCNKELEAVKRELASAEVRAGKRMAALQQEVEALREATELERVDEARGEKSSEELLELQSQLRGCQEEIGRQQSEIARQEAELSELKVSEQELRARLRSEQEEASCREPQQPAEEGDSIEALRQQVQSLQQRLTIEREESEQAMIAMHEAHSQEVLAFMETAQKSQEQHIKELASTHTPRKGS